MSRIGCPERLIRQESTMRNTHAGKVAIVTGAGRGIGAAIASQLGSESAKVVVNYNTGKAAAEDVVAAILRDGGKALAVRADVGTAAGAERLFTVAEAELGPVDYLVNNAGTILYKPLADVTEEEFDFLFAVNVRGSFLTCKLAARRLREGGSIVNFSSSTTALMLPKYATYVATKGAVEQMSHIFAKEMGARGIRVNVVSPGPTDTELFNQGKTEEDRQRMAKMAALSRLGTPADIARVVSWLLSEDAGWVTGQNVRANGGLI
jgi:3-oxoacyl-[acyl-carrier protein] reductase